MLRALASNALPLNETNVSVFPFPLLKIQFATNPSFSSVSNKPFWLDISSAFNALSQMRA